MSADLEVCLTPARQAAARGELLVFAGAGISMLPPSYLPDWKGFNAALLEEIKTSSLSVAGIEGSAAIKRLGIDQIAVEAFSDTVVHSLAGDDYFPLLKILDSDRPNAYHEAIAELARRAACPAIVTTNFDRLLELAFAATPLDVFSAPDDFRRDPREACALYKIHGSVSVTSTIVDTVTQKLRGLPFPIRTRLADLFGRYHVLVVGFSGADLDFGSDYLALSTLKGRGGAITWVIQPGRTLHARAGELIREVEGTPVEADLSDVFKNLGARRQNPAESRSASPGRGQVEADARARLHIREWLDGMGGGPTYSLQFCATLAEKLGWREDARTLRKAVVTDLDRPGGGLPLTALPAFNSLATAAEEDGDLEAGERWVGRALRLLSSFEERRRKLSASVKPAGMRQIGGQRFSAYLQLGRLRAARGDASGAREAFQHARSAAAESGDDQNLSMLVANEALLLRREGAGAEKQLEVIRRGWSLAKKSGSAQVMAESALNEAMALISIGEYDSALNAIERAEGVARWSGRLLARLTPDLLRADITARRGRLAEAFAGFDRAISQAAADPVLEAMVRRSAIPTLAYLPGGRERSLGYVASILDAMAAGRIPRHGVPGHLQSEAEIRELRDAIMGITAAERPGFLDPPPIAQEDERNLRGMLVKAEYEGYTGRAAEVLLTLANRRYEPTKPRRQLDLAEAALRAAERAGDRQSRFGALMLITAGCDLSGNYQGAIDAARKVLDANPPAGQEMSIRAAQNLGVVLVRIGRSSEAEPLFRAAQEYFSKTGQTASQVRSTIALSEALAAAGDRAGALKVLNECEAAINATGDPLAIHKRDALVVSLSTDISGRVGPPPFFSGGDAKLTMERIDQLRRMCESPEEICDVAALAIFSGHMRDALEMLLAAQGAFHANSDEPGLAHCFHLLADAAQENSRWDSAADLTRFALRLEQANEDISGQTGSFAALSLQFLQTGELRGAQWAADQCLECAGNGNPSRFTAIAKYAAAEVKRRGGVRLKSNAAKVVGAEIAAASDLPAGAPLREWLEERVAQW